MTAQNRYPFGVYLAWVAVGAGLSFGVLSILSIGVFVLAVTIVATFFLARRSEAGAGVAGLVSGFGLPLLYVAFLNRSGPGTICHSHQQRHVLLGSMEPVAVALDRLSARGRRTRVVHRGKRRRARERSVAHD